MRLIRNRYQLLVADIDGTLVNKDGIISSEDKEALTRAGDSGIRVSLSTGRVAQACLSIIDQLSLHGCHIFFDGALVSNPENGKEIYVEPIGQEIVEQMVEFAHRHNINLELYSATRYFVEQETWGTNIRRQFFGLEPIVVDFTSLWQKERIIKGTVTVRSAEGRAKVADFYHYFEGRLRFSWTKTPAYPEADFINLIAPQVSKGKALEALASHLGIALTEVVAVGDGTNDISLLSKAGLGVAMGNAPDEVKALADYVTLDVDHNGVAEAIGKFLV